MPDDVVRAVCQKLLCSEYAVDEVEICLHGGEPLAAGINWFEMLMATIREFAPRNRLNVRVSIQTNATLINNEWLHFFDEHGIEIGVSIDGPARLHDLSRRNWSNQGSYLATVAGIRALASARILFSFICVLQRASIGAADEIYKLFKELGPVEVAFNIEEREGPHTESSLDMSSAKDSVGRFLDDYRSLCERDGFPHEVREFRQMGSIVAGLLAGKTLHNHMVHPLSCITVATDGAFGTFAPELLEMPSDSSIETFEIGNILRDDLASALKTEKFLSIHAQIVEGVAACKAKCFYFPFCGGGSPSNKLAELGSLRGTETFYCRNGVQATVDHALKRIAKEI